MTTAELLQLLAGSEASSELWAELVRRSGTRLWAVCRAVAGEQLADDAFQNGLMTIRRRASRFRPGADPEASAQAWMVTVVHHAAIDLVRSERRRTTREGASMTQEPAATPVAAPIEDPVPAQLALQALEALPERHREVIRLRLLGGLDARQTAAVLGCPPEQVRVRLARALQLLRERCPPACGAVSVSALADSLQHAAMPPATLPATAVHAATLAFSMPLAAGLSLGVIMTISAIALGLVASASLLLISTAHPGATTAAEQPTVAIALAPPASDLELAQDILAMPSLRRVIASAVRHIAEMRGIHGPDEAMDHATIAAVNADRALWRDYAQLMTAYADGASLRSLHAFLLTPAGMDYLILDQHLQETFNADAMQKSFAAVVQAASSVLVHPGSSLPVPTDVSAPRLGFARGLARAGGYDAVIECQIEQSLAASFPARSTLAVRSALDQALDAYPRWQDPILQVYEQYLTHQEMEQQYVYSCSLAGRRQAASLPTIIQATNQVLSARQDQLLEDIRQRLQSANPSPAPRAAPGAGTTAGF